MMNPGQPCARSSQRKKDQYGRRGPKLSIAFPLLVIFIGLSILVSCKPSETPAPTLEMLTPGPSPTPTVSDSGFPVTDDGSALPPQVVEQHPAIGQGLSIRGEITLIFNQPMDESSTRNAWRMIGPLGETIPGTVTWTDARTLMFRPDQSLQMASGYQVTINAGAMTAEGVRLSESLRFDFTTVGELQVSQTFPINGTADIASDAVITAIFNRPVVPLVISEQGDQLPNPFEIDPPVDGEVEWVNTSVVAFRPDKPLDSGAAYTVSIRAGLYDAARETQLAQDYTWRFVTTTPSIRYLELSNGMRNPDPDATDILLDETFTLHFLQSMDIPSTEAALSLRVRSGSAVFLKTEWNEDNTSVTVIPARNLSLNTTYTLDLSPTARAADGGLLREGLTWSFTTIPSPSVLYISPPEGPGREGYDSGLYIKFASPMNIESVKRRIMIKPEPGGEIQWWYDEYDWSIRAWVLEPSTEYEVRALPGMLDIYENATTREYVVEFTTEAASPRAGLQMPYGPSILRVGGPQEFYITYRNIGSYEAALYNLTSYQFISFLNGDLNQYDYYPPAADLVWETRQASTGKLNENVLEPLRPTTSSGEELPPGFYFLTFDTPDISHSWSSFLDTHLLVVVSANLTFKTTGSEALTWVTDLQSGKPMRDVPLTVYDHNFRGIGQGKSDSDGLLVLDVPTPPEPWDERYVMTDGNQPFAFASSTWGSGVNLDDFGIWNSYYAPAGRPKVYVYTDRPIYRPDQPVYFKGIVRIDDDLAYDQPAQTKVHVEINNYMETIYEADLPLSSLGTFDGELTLSPEAALGQYSIEVQFPGKPDQIGGVGFSVAEYRKPEFQVQVEASPTNVLTGEVYAVTVSADYYSGGGVSDALVEWTLSASPFNFSPSVEYSGYSFADYERDLGYEELYYRPATEIIAEGQGHTDANGKLVLSLKADLSEFNASRELTFEATVTDISRNAVSGRATIIAHQSSIYPGVRPTVYVGTANHEQTFDVVALDWESNPIPAQKVSVQIVERRWYSVQEQDATGRIQWKSTVEEIPVARSQVTTDNRGKASVAFTPRSGGVYSAKVSALDSKGNPGRAAAYIWVTGPDYIPWRQTNDRSFDLVADRSSYVPGDTAEILIASPFQGESYALVTVERGHIYSREVLRLTSNSTLYRLPITPDLAPNTYVSVVVVKGIDETNPRPNYKMGMLEISVDTREQEVLVSIKADREKASPGESVTYTVVARDVNNRPIDAELSLGLSDLATLSLASPNSQPILEFFYNHRTLGVWTSVPIGLNLEDYNATINEYIEEGEGMGSGGGKGEGVYGVIAVRQDFPDTALWEAHIRTGSDGQATVNVTLPDNLTTWRMDARAVTADTRVGQTTHDLISSRPLLVRPQTPRFLVAGDVARLGVAVHNNTDQPMSVDVSLIAQGLSLLSEASVPVDIPARQQAYVAWDVNVESDSQRVDLVFQAEGATSDGERFEDASRPPQGTLDNLGLPVYRYEAFETVGTSGQVTSAGTRLEGINLPSSWTTSAGQLTIEISPSLAAGMTDGLTYLEEYPYECVEQTVSRFLPNVISTRAFKAAGLSDPDLEANLREQVNNALQRLMNWQNPDGGWGWWPNVSQQSDVQTSAYVVLGLVEARGARYTISEWVLDRALDFLGNQLQPITLYEDPLILNRQSFVLYVLARAGRPSISATVQLYEQRQSMAIYARAFMAQTFFQFDPQDPRLQTLLSDLANAALTSATGTHWEEGERDFANWNTDTRTTAIVLSTLSQMDVDNPLNANAVRWLMSHRSNGYWRGTQETAWALMGLTNWMEASGELRADYQYAVAFNEKRLGGGFANQATLRRTHYLHVDVAEMLTDQMNRLAFARDEGPGNLYYTAHLNVAVPVSEVHALDQGIIVSREYYPFEDPEASLSDTEPITEASQGDLLLVRLTLVAPSALHYVMIEEPLPAGLEAVDQSLEISQQNLEIPRSYRWEDMFSRGWGWWYFEHTQLRDEKVVLSASYLPAGTYIYTYLVRATTVGSFNVIPTTAQEFYFPEVYGRAEGGTFVVHP
jgi:uncharacterized protein YfaS (alpha-2-macroglobulin family)